MEAVKRNEDYPNENKQRLFVQSVLSQANWSPPLALGRDLINKDFFWLFYFYSFIEV